MNRRDLIKTIGVGAGAGLVGRRVHALEPEGSDVEPVGILIDTTRCIGCRECEWACAEAHGESGVEFDEDFDFEYERTTSETQWTVVQRHETEADEIFVKRGCMHCLQPACAAACLTKAMTKTEEGPVGWNEDRCMGCRYCMLSCPFDVPKFEYDSPVPRIQKCTMCWERLAEGDVPACVENCPMETLTFGLRSELLDEARRRIYNHPDEYVHHIYGEHEAGGTSVMYLASEPFEELGFRTDLEDEPYPTFTREFLYAVPVVLTLVPPFLVALHRATKGLAEKAEEEDRS